MTNQSTKQVLLSIMAVAIIVIAAVGVSYAAFSYSKSGSVNNTIRTGNIYFKYNEPTNGIALLDAVPIPDVDGKNLFGSGNVFDFGVTSTIKGNTKINYEIVLEGEPSSTLDAKKLKVYLVSVDDEKTPVAGEVVVLEPTYLSDLKQSVNKVGAKLLYNATATEGENIIKNYRFKMWIPEEDADGKTIDLSSINNSNVQESTLKVGIYAKAN